MQLDEIREHLQWWHTLSPVEKKCLLRLGLKIIPTIKDRLLADIAKQAERDAKRAKKKGKPETG